VADVLDGAVGYAVVHITVLRSQEEAVTFVNAPLERPPSTLGYMSRLLTLNEHELAALLGGIAEQLRERQAAAN